VSDKTLGFLVKVKSFTSIIFKMSYSRYFTMDALGKGSRFPSRALEEGG
jgi:hypothetical protein